MVNPLAILGLPPGSSYEQAVDRYRVLAKMYHPDKNSIGTERFREITEAMDAIEGDRLLLNSSASCPERTVGKDLWVTTDVKMEDVLFRDKLSFAVHPRLHCPRCNGTGSADRRYHTCRICEGKGRIPGEIMRMVAGDNTCPGCEGTGVDIPEEARCSLCKGSSLVHGVRMKELPAGPAMLSGGVHSLVFAGEGHAAPYGGAAGNLHLTIKVTGTAGLEYLNGKAVVWVEVSPATYVVGGPVSVEIMGERVSAEMQPMTGRADVVFRDKPLQIRATLVIPYRLSKQAKAQYAVLRALELKESGKAGVTHARDEDPKARRKLPGGKKGQQRHKIPDHPVKQKPSRKKGPKSGPGRGQ
jgi:DnaJ-class molecular chaperone